MKWKWNWDNKFLKSEKSKNTSHCLPWITNLSTEIGTHGRSNRNSLGN